MLDRRAQEAGEIPNLASRALAIRQKYGPEIGWNELLQILADRACVPFPCQIRFEADLLLPGEFAHAFANGLKPEEGYTIFVHPVYADQLARVPYLVLQQVGLVSSPRLGTVEEAESFGAGVLGLSPDEYYRVLCELAGQVTGGDELC